MASNPVVLNVIKGHRKTVGRVAKKIIGLAAEINEAIPDLASDVTLAGLYLSNAEERLLWAETRLEDARKRFAS